jgi:hypothetical protein
MLMDEDHCNGLAWGFLATNVPDPPHCIATCRETFLKGWLLENETFESVCERLSNIEGSADGKDKPFWSLYCCDAHLCGVDNLENRGKDRMFLSPTPPYNLS